MAEVTVKLNMGHLKETEILREHQFWKEGNMSKLGGFRLIIKGVSER